MKLVFQDDFARNLEHDYPCNWVLEKNCENHNSLGWVEKDGFCLLYAGNKHLPLTPLLSDFTLDFVCRSDRFFSPVEILVYFRYDRSLQQGYCLRYQWGITGAQTHFQQKEFPVYRAFFCRYYGNRADHKYETIAESQIAGFCSDLALPQKMRLEVNGKNIAFFHNEHVTGKFEDPAQTFVLPGFLAFDRGGFNKPAFSLQSVEVFADLALTEKVVMPERSATFPASVNGMISPFVFHVSIMESAGRRIMRTRLTGGPAKDKVPTDHERCRFNEKLVNPYVRIETADGKPFGTFRIFNGEIGLNDLHWNPLTSVMLPASGECPLEADFVFEDFPDNPLCFIGYDYYVAEDSICRAGGPAEALIDAAGAIQYAGKPLTDGMVTLDFESPADKVLCARIPKDIPFYDEAVRFAQSNHYFYESEQPRMRGAILRRGSCGAIAECKLMVTLENAFREPLGEPVRYTLTEAPNHLPHALHVDTLRTDELTFPRLAVGVYHARAELFQGGRRIAECRRAFEVMSDAPAARPAPLASGLPALYLNILGGYRNEHFFPWGDGVVDTAHYNTGGNNFFRTAHERRCWDLLHVYGRQWLFFQKLFQTPEELSDREAINELIKACDAARLDMWRNDLWIRSQYNNPEIYNALLDFLRRPDFKPVPGGSLSYESVAANPEKGVSREQFRELVEQHWKAWILFFRDVVSKRLIPQACAQVRDVNPDCGLFMFCPVYPTYGSVYKSGYSPLYFGRDLRSSGLEHILTGPNGFEDYPYSSGYAIARGIYQLASCKLECPDLKMYPEMFGINGETADAHVIYANPPYGRSNPPRGFLLKQFYEYSFGVTWFDRQGFRFWDDHGYYPKTWSCENYEEMLYAYSFITRVKPVKPMRTTAFVFSMAACLTHPDYYEYDEAMFSEGSIFNTAEESVAFAYECARGDGQQAGFVVKLEDLAGLSEKDAHTLVLPPLGGVGEDERAAIRRLHEAGVCLMGFEDVTGLEDIFGVRAAGRETRITKITVAPAAMMNEISGMIEQTAHPLSKCRYQAAGAEPLLLGDGNIPVLMFNRTPWGRTAFWNVPPTVVRRAQARIPTYGQESISALINRATALVMRQLGRPAVETTAGKTLAFWDEHGVAHVIVAEDAWPAPGHAINPLVTVCFPDAGARIVKSDKLFAIVAKTDDTVKIRLSLERHESARLSFGFTR